MNLIQSRTFPFAIGIFCGAFLLFQVQPMIGKFILPWFGGGPGVWTSCMVFFQLLLLAGYAYAHALTRWLPLRAQTFIHLALIAVAIVFLPIIPSESWKPSLNTDPRLQILLVLTATVGAPYFVLSATGPLLQHWFSLAKPGASPYRLYALSNLGSLLALLSYPFFFEVEFSRTTQAQIWGIGLVAYGLACVACSRQLNYHTGQSAESPVEASPATDLDVETPTLNLVLWMVLPACASSLLLAVTNKVSQDVAVFPMLWIGPLAVYLLSFILCFDTRRWYRRAPFAAFLAVTVGAACWALHSGDGLSMSMQLLIYGSVLAAGCMTCHGELYLLRPPARDLTRFYLLISTGGAAGGLFVGLAAPALFNDFFELHGTLFAIVLLLLITWWYRPLGERLGRLRWPAAVVCGLGLLILGWQLLLQATYARSIVVEKTRNFYGVLTVLKEEPHQATSPKRTLSHGTTTHGLQMVHPGLEKQPTTYYGRSSGIGLALRVQSQPIRRIGVIGLGVGTLAAYTRTGDVVRVYEINPDVVRMAYSHFTYLSNALGRIEIVIGDGRLSLEREEAQGFDILALDAFSSDAIPVHLLTREAFEIYRKHLKPGGILAVHITNRHLELEPVLGNASKSMGTFASLVAHAEPADRWWLLSSRWVLIADDPKTLQAPPIAAVASELRLQEERIPLWTDDRAAIWPTIRF